MSHFYGYLGGGRGEKTCTGHKTCGIHCTLQSHSAKLRARLYHDDETGTDRYEVEVLDARGLGKPVASGQLD